MRRTQLKKIAREIESELEGKGYGYWYSQDLTEPRTFTRMVSGQEVQVEVLEYERNEEFIQLGICVDDGGFFNASFPVGACAIVYRDKETPGE